MQPTENKVTHVLSDVLSSMFFQKLWDSALVSTFQCGEVFPPCIASSLSGVTVSGLVLPLQLSQPVEVFHARQLAKLPLKKKELKQLIVCLVCNIFNCTFNVADIPVIDPCYRSMVAHCSTLCQNNFLKFSWGGITISAVPWYFKKSLSGSSYMPINGAVVGTCFRETESQLQHHLFNVYSQLNEGINSSMKAQVFIRHSAASSPDRMEMLFSLVNHIIREQDSLLVNGVARVRLFCLLTRKSEDIEEVMWNGQVEALGNILKTSSAKALSVVHVSMQANCNTNFNFWNHGEDINSDHNLRAWVQYFLWLLEDLKDCLSLLGNPFSDTLVSQTIEELSAMLTEITTVSELKELQGLNGVLCTCANVDSTKLMLARLQQKLRWVVLEVLENLKGENSENVQRLRVAGVLLWSLITQRNQFYALSILKESGSTPPGRKLERIDEFLCLSLLDRCLNVQSCCNCKSGCDRTGLVHAAATALNIILQMHNKDLFSLTEVCTRFAEFSHAIDDRVDSLESYLSQLEQWQSTTDHSSTDYKYYLISELRNAFLLTLMEVGWKVNIQSSGMNGIKFNFGSLFAANPHVLTILPPFVIGRLSEAETDHKLQRIHSHGRIDENFGLFLNGLSEFRGS